MPNQCAQNTPTCCTCSAKRTQTVHGSVSMTSSSMDMLLCTHRPRLPHCCHPTQLHRTRLHSPARLTPPMHWRHSARHRLHTLSHVAQPLREPARAAAGQAGARPQQPMRSTRGRSRRCCRTHTPASASSVRLAAYSASGLRGARSARFESDAYAPSCLPCAPEHQLADVLFFSIFSHLPLPTICSALLHYIFDQYL